MIIFTALITCSPLSRHRRLYSPITSRDFTSNMPPLSLSSKGLPSTEFGSCFKDNTEGGRERKNRGEQRCVFCEQSVGTGATMWRATGRRRVFDLRYEGEVKALPNWFPRTVAPCQPDDNSPLKTCSGTVSSSCRGSRCFRIELARLYVNRSAAPCLGQHIESGSYSFCAARIILHSFLSICDYYYDSFESLLLFFSFIFLYSI